MLKKWKHNNKHISIRLKDYLCRAGVLWLVCWTAEARSVQEYTYTNEASETEQKRWKNRQKAWLTRWASIEIDGFSS